MTVHTMDPAQPTTSANVTLKSIHCPPREADHQNSPSRLAKEQGLAGNSLRQEKGGAGMHTGDPKGKLRGKGGGG